MFDGKDWPSEHVEFINSRSPHLLGAWVLVHWQCDWWNAEVTKQAFVMICLLPPCDSIHVSLPV